MTTDRGPPPPSGLADTVALLARYLALIELLVPRRDTGVRISARLAPESAAPWNAAAAWVALGIHADARRLELALRASAGLPQRFRGGDSANTAKALEAIGRLERAAGAGTVSEVSASLQAWLRAAQRLRAIDQLVQWFPVRRSCHDPDCPALPWHQDCAGNGCETCAGTGRASRPHGHAVLCEYCDTPNLRAAPAAGLLMCTYHDCEDADGRRPIARLDISRVTAEWILAWRDGHVQPVIP